MVVEEPSMAYVWVRSRHWRHYERDRVKLAPREPCPFRTYLFRQPVTQPMTKYFNANAIHSESVGQERSPNFLIAPQAQASNQIPPVRRPQPLYSHCARPGLQAVWLALLDSCCRMCTFENMLPLLWNKSTSASAEIWNP